MKTLESFFSRTAQFGLLIYLTDCFGLLIVFRRCSRKMA